MSGDVGYFSVADRGTYGHWDISTGQRRVFCIRGEPGNFGIRDERLEVGWTSRDQLASIRFATPYSALQ